MILEPSHPHIGTLAEKSLHAALKTWYGRAGDQFEIQVDGFVIDIVREDHLIEIQTRNFTALKRKLTQLLAHHTVHLIHPIPQEKWIVRQTAAGEFVSRRKSPKQGQAVDIFYELVRIPHLIAQPNFTLEVALTQEEEIWRDDGQGSWRRKRWSLHDRHLLAVVDQIVFLSPADLQALLPPALPQPFTNQALAAALNCRIALAQKMTYTLCQTGSLVTAGKQGRALLYQLPTAPGKRQLENTKPPAL